MTTKKRRGRYVYSVPDVEDANTLAELATAAIESAREQAPDQSEKATALYQAIYGPPTREVG